MTRKYYYPILVALLAAVCAASGWAQEYDIEDFAHKWQKQRNQEVNDIITVWLTGGDDTVMADHVVELVRLEALLVSVDKSDVSLYVPQLRITDSREIPGQLLMLMLAGQEMNFDITAFFAGRRFVVEALPRRIPSLNELANIYGDPWGGGDE